MVNINAFEAMEIRKRYPREYIVRTAKQKSKRHHYMVAETTNVVRLLSIMRGEPESAIRN